MDGSRVWLKRHWYMGDISSELSYVEAAFTSNWFVTTTIVVCLIFGVVIVRLGLIELRSIAVATASAGAYQPARGGMIAGWRVFPSATSEQVNRELLLQRNRVLAYTAVGMGAGVILAAVASAGLALGLYSATAQDRSARLSMDLAPIVILTGAALGYASGVVCLRRNNRSTASPTGVRRTLRDYCSPLIWPFPIVVTSLSALLLTDASLSAQSVEIHWFGVPVSISAPLVGGLVATMLTLTGGIILLMAALVASAPNVLTSADAQADQRANDDLRASVSTTLVFLVWMNASFLTTNTISLQSTLAFPAINGPMGALSTALTLLQLPMVIGWLPMVLMMSSARMGGRLTGWWWQSWPELRERTVEGG
jgi:hypothetical protein